MSNAMLLSEQNIPSSPPLLSTRLAPSLMEDRRPSLKRSRVSANDLSMPSSDAAVFSSDDPHEEALENYETPRRTKRLFAGSPYASHATTKPQRQTKKAFTRNFDSAVWMCSDSGSSVNDGIDEAGEDQRLGSGTAVSKLPKAETMQSHAKQLISAALESNADEVDLSGLGLTELNDHTLYPLRSFGRVTSFIQSQDDAPSSDAGGATFQPFSTSPQLYLSLNNLRSLPAEIFNLEHLTVLSLRNNNLTELPPSIARLVNLTELNLAANELRWLPFELMPLLSPQGKLTRLNAGLNPLMSPLDRRHDKTLSILHREIAKGRATAYYMDRWFPDKEDRHSAEPWVESVRASRISGSDRRRTRRSFDRVDAPRGRRCSFVRRTTLVRLDPSGVPSDVQQRLPSTCTDVELRRAIDDDSTEFDLEKRWRRNESYAPSLTESVLGSFLASSFVSMSSLHNVLSPPAATAAAAGQDEVATPASVLAVLDSARRAKAYGKLACAVCKKRFVIPRAEWVEFWHDAEGQAGWMWFPVVRRACSWGCAAEVADTPASAAKLVEEAVLEAADDARHNAILNAAMAAGVAAIAAAAHYVAADTSDEEVVGHAANVRAAAARVVADLAAEDGGYSGSESDYDSMEG